MECSINRACGSPLRRTLVIAVSSARNSSKDGVRLSLPSKAQSNGLMQKLVRLRCSSHHFWGPYPCGLGFQSVQGSLK